MDLDYAVTSVALGESPDAILARLVEDGELVKSPGRRDVLKQMAGAAVQAPLVRSLAIGAVTQAVSQAATAAVKQVVKPSLPSHINHPQAGKPGAIIPRHEAIAGAHNIFRQEHGSDVRLKPSDIEDVPYGYRPETVKKFDWQGHTGHDPHGLMKKWRESGVSKMEIFGHVKTKLTPEQFASENTPSDLVHHFGFRERDVKRHGRYTSDLPGPNVRVFENPNSTHSVVSHDPDTDQWSHTVMYYGDHDAHEWDTKTGHGSLSLLQHLHGHLHGDRSPITHVNKYVHPETGVTHYERVHQGSVDQFSGLPRRESNWSSVHPETKAIHSLGYGNSPQHGEWERRDTEAYKKAKNSGAWGQHYEDHGDVLAFSSERKDDWTKGLETDPESPGYDNKKFMSALHGSHTGHFVIENPLHWNNLKSGENSLYDKKHFDAMHVDPQGKITRFRVPFDPNNRDIEGFDAESGGIHYRDSEHLEKKTKERFQSLQGPQWKHYDLAHKSLGLDPPDYPGFSWRDQKEQPVTDMEKPSIGHNNLEKGTLRTIVHPSGKWELHVADPVIPTHEVTSTGRISPHPHYDYSSTSFRPHSEGESVVDLRKSLMAVKKELGPKKEVD